MLRFVTLLLLSVTLLRAEDTLADMVAKTDMSNPDSVFELAQWCSQHNMPSKANTYYNQILKLDKDHEGARTALGQVKVGSNWVPKSMVKVQPKKPGEEAPTGPAERQASGNGPSAAEIKWDLTVPKDPMPQNKFISDYIDKMPGWSNDSREMDAAINTLMMPENLPLAIPRMCEALTRADFNDLYGGSMLAMTLIKNGKMATAKPLLPFLVTASVHVNDADDLSNFAFIVAMFRDRRVVPRLIELMSHSDENVRSSATTAVATISLLPEKDLSVDRAKNWWNLNYNVSDQQIYQEQLNSRDPKVAAQAAMALYDYRDKSIVPVLCKLLRNDDKEVNSTAIAVIEKITGNTWSYDVNDKQEDKDKRSKAIEAWWKEEQFRFVWIEDKKNNDKKAPTAVAANDPCVQWVADLSSVEGNKAQVSEQNLLGKGEAAVPALIDGLSNATIIVRRKCNDLLGRISKQTVKFDASDSQEERDKGITAWKKWATEKKIIKEPAQEEAEGDNEKGEESP